jgi:hypothetical protein
MYRPSSWSGPWWQASGKLCQAADALGEQ